MIPRLIMKILITGISGYLGSQLANTLVTDHELAGTVRRYSDVKRLKNKENIQLIKIDDIHWIKEVQIFNPDIIINTAAIYGRNNESRADLIQANILFPIMLIEGLSKNNRTVFINCGTSLQANVSFYALTKNQFIDLYEKEKLNNVKFINMRLEHFFGSEDDNSKFTTYLVKACLNGERIKLTQCEQVRDFIYMPDLLNAFKTIIFNIDKFGGFEHIDVGYGVGVALKEFVSNVIRCTGFNGEVLYGAIPYRENESMYSVANIEKLKSFGWMPMYKIEDAINEYVEWMKVGN